ncbi:MULTISPECIES: hypothetical protein [unclassified Streptomyces]|uniref:hypothetical protein n=1 Tax=unclassified Streptomyces TaxID=2593676 RepID=UPI00366816C6
MKTAETAETAYAVTGLRAEQATAERIAARARAHRVIENTVHRTKDVTFGEGASRLRHHSPVVVSGSRGPARAALRRAGGSASPADDVPTLSPKRSPPSGEPGDHIGHPHFGALRIPRVL